MLVLVFLFATGCREQPVTEISIAGYDSTQTPIRISIFDLVNDIRVYDSKFIETTGFLSNNFEDFAIYTNRVPLSETHKGFWIELNPALKISEESLEKLNGKKVTIKGVVDISDKGHLSSYVATIKGIYHISYNH